MTSTILVLINKAPNPKSFTELRPINLCSFSYKIISKIMNTRLSSLLRYLISEEQTELIAGRNLFDNVAIAQEMVV